MATFCEQSVATCQRHCRGGAITTHPDIPLCAGCGICCHLVVELQAGDRIPEEFVVEHDGVRCMDQRGDGACIALDPATRLCTIYDVRPQTCRDFHRGEELCIGALARHEAARVRRAARIAG